MYRGTEGIESGVVERAIRHRKYQCQNDNLQNHEQKIQEQKKKAPLENESHLCYTQR
jgi:hypothetical protein